MGVSTWTVPEDSGNFCTAGGRFGTHSSNENFTPIYYNRVLFIAHFNAGVRAVDIRDPFHPKEIGYYIPAITDKTDKRCVGQGRGAAMQDRDSDQQRRSGRPRLHLRRRSRQHRDAHPRTDRLGAPGGGFSRARFRPTRTENSGSLARRSYIVRSMKTRYGILAVLLAAAAAGQKQSKPLVLDEQGSFFVAARPRLCLRLRLRRPRGPARLASPPATLPSTRCTCSIRSR